MREFARDYTFLELNRPLHALEVEWQRDYDTLEHQHLGIHGDAPSDGRIYDRARPLLDDTDKHQRTRSKGSCGCRR